MNNDKVENPVDKVDDETFDMNPEEIRQLGYYATDLMVNYLKNIDTDPIIPNKNLEQIRTLIDEPLPQEGTTPDRILDECQKKLITHAVRTGHPRFFGWIVPSGTTIGAVADGLASVLNQNVSVSGSAMATAVELLVIDWIKQILGYDPKAAGILVSGGSMANLTGLMVARNVNTGFDVNTNGMQQKEQNQILYVSKEVHLCIPRIANILGIGTNNIRWVNVDEELRLDPKDLNNKIKEDIECDKHPFAVAATAGTVNTGAIDPLDSIADISEQNHLWFHVDGAYGGFAAASSRLKPLLHGIERADSVVLDPHKWLFIPYEAGCVLVKNPLHLKQTFSVNADYLHLNSISSQNKDIDFADYGPQLSRGFRALKIWMTLKQYGVKKYGRVIDQNVFLTKYFADLIEASSDFKIAIPPSLSIVCFQYFPQDLQQLYYKSAVAQQEKIENYLNILNPTIIETMRTDGRALLSSTIIGKKFVLRACIINYRTTKKDITTTLEIIREIGNTTDTKLRKTFI